MRLSDRKTSLTFETDSAVYSAGCKRSVVVECAPLVATVRLSGTRQQFSVTWDAIYALACRLAVTAERAEKRGCR